MLYTFIHARSHVFKQFLFLKIVLQSHKMSHGNSPTPDRTNSLSSPLSIELVNCLKESMEGINTDPYVFVVFGASVS